MAKKIAVTVLSTLTMALLSAWKLSSDGSINWCGTVFGGTVYCNQQTQPLVKKQLNPDTNNKGCPGDDIFCSPDK
jgi:hypothetical protein